MDPWDGFCNVQISCSVMGGHEYMSLLIAVRGLLMYRLKTQILSSPENCIESWVIRQRHLS